MNRNRPIFENQSPAWRGSDAIRTIGNAIVAILLAVPALPGRADEPPVVGFLESIPPVAAARTDVKPIVEISTDIRLPPDPQIENLQQYAAPPPIAPLLYHSPHEGYYLNVASRPSLNFCYRPLYFEEVALERYGHTWGRLQPAVSAVRFYGNVAVLPYRLVTQRPGFCTWHLYPAPPGIDALYP